MLKNRAAKLNLLNYLIINIINDKSYSKKNN